MCAAKKIQHSETSFEGVWRCAPLGSSAVNAPPNWAQLPTLTSVTRAARIYLICVKANRSILVLRTFGTLGSDLCGSKHTKRLKG